MSKQTFRHTLTPRGIIIPDTRVAAKSNGALGLPGLGQLLLSYIEMEGMGELWTVFTMKERERKKKETMPGALLWDYEKLAKSQNK